jgi:hypothetical protein
MNRPINFIDHRMEGMRAVRDYPLGEAILETVKNAIEASPEGNTTIEIGAAKWNDNYSFVVDEPVGKISGYKAFVINQGAIELPKHLDFGSSGKTKGFKANENHGKGGKAAGLRDNVAVLYFSYKDAKLKLSAIKNEEGGDVVVCGQVDEFGIINESHQYEGASVDQVIEDFGLTNITSRFGNEWTITMHLGRSYTEECLDNNMIMTATNPDYQINKSGRLDVVSTLMSRCLRFRNANNGEESYRVKVLSDCQTGGKPRQVKGLLEVAENKDGVDLFSFEVPLDPRIQEVHIIRNAYRSNGKQRHLEQIRGGLRSGFVSQSIVQNRLDKGTHTMMLRDLGINEDYSGWNVFIELTDECEGKESRTSHLFNGENVTFDEEMCLAIKAAMPKEVRDLIESCRRENSINEKSSFQAIWDMEKSHKLEWSGNSTKRTSTVVESSSSKINSSRNSNTSSKPAVKTRRGIAGENPFEDFNKDDAPFEVDSKYPFVYQDSPSEGGSIKFCSTGSAWNEFIMKPLWEACGDDLMTQSKANDVIIREVMMDVWSKIFTLNRYNLSSPELSLNHSDVKKSLESTAMLGWYVSFPKSVLNKIKRELTAIKESSEELEKV